MPNSSWLRFRIFIYLTILAGSASTAHCQNVCVGPAPNLPCLNQPKAEDTEVQGQVSPSTTDIFVVIASSNAIPVKLKKNKFTLQVMALGPMDTVNLEDKSGKVLNSVAIRGMVCTNPSVGPCVDQPIVGAGSITGVAIGAFPPQVQIIAGSKSQPLTTVVGMQGDFTALLDANQGLSEYDQIQVVDATNQIIVGPVSVVAIGGAHAPACSATSPADTLPCIGPVQAGQDSISGFAVPGSVVEIDVGGVDKGDPPLKSDGSFTFDISSLAAGQTITAKLISAGGGVQTQNGTTQTDSAQKSGGEAQKQPSAGGAPAGPRTMSTTPSTTAPAGVSSEIAASCSATSPHPCISPVDPTKGTIAGFADKGFTLEIDLGAVGKLIPPVQSDGSFTTTWSGLAAGGKITIEQTSPDGNTTGTLTATVAAPKVNATNPPCSAANAPCLDPIQTDNPVISGYVATGSTVQVDAGGADKTPDAITPSSTGQFSFGLSSVLPGEVVTIKQTTAQGSTPLSASAVVTAAPAAATATPQTSASNNPPANPSSPPASTSARAASTAAPAAYSSSSSSSVQGAANQTATALHSATVVSAPPKTNGYSSSLYTLGLIGTNVTSTSTSTSGPQQQFYASFNLAAPIPFLGPKACPASDQTRPLEQKCWAWVNPMISSAPAAANSQLTSFSSPTALASGVGGQTLSQITQTFSLQGGFQWAFNKPYWGRQFGWGTDWARSTISAILGFGFSTPYSSSVQNPSEFTLSDNLAAQFTQSSAAATGKNQSLAQVYPELASALCGGSNYGFANPSGSPMCSPSYQASGTNAGKPYTDVAFLLENRSRFDRDYFAGFRFQTYYFTGACEADTKSTPEASNAGDCKVVNTFPGTLDVRFGQDEAVTGGYLRGLVMTLAGTYPVPGTQGAIRIFGSVYLRLHRNYNSVALALVPPTTPVAITDPSLIIQPTVATDQDYYRLGIGVDLIPLFSKWILPNSSSSNSGSTTATTTTTPQ